VLGRQSLAGSRRFWSEHCGTAICAKPGELLAGQLLYGDSMHRIDFVRSESDGRERDAETCNLSCQKSSTVVPTRGAGLVQIANALTE
jgi:hypothetical protein